MKFAITFTLLLFITSFVPAIQIIFAYANGAVFSTAENIIGSNSPFLSIILNLLFSVIFIFLYYNSEKLYLKIVNSILILFFLNSFVMLMKIELYGNEESEFYFLQFFVSSIIISVTLISSEYIKRTKKTCW